MPQAKFQPIMEGDPSKLTNHPLNAEMFPPLTPEEYQELKDDIQERGIQDPLQVRRHNGTFQVITGHHRKQIAIELNIKVPYILRSDLKEDWQAEEHLIKDNLFRRQLNDATFYECCEQLKKSTKERLELQQSLQVLSHIGTKNTNNVEINKIDTLKEIGKKKNISKTKMFKIQKVGRDAPEEIKKKWKDDKITTNQAYNEIIKTEKKERMLEETKSLAKEYQGLKDIQVTHGDFVEETKSLKDNSVDFILTDPPYGKEYLDLWENLGVVAERILKPSGFLAAYSGPMNMPIFINALSKHLNYFWTISLIHTGPTQIINGRNAMSQWKPILVFYKPPLKLPAVFKDSIIGKQADKKHHPWAQSIYESQELLKYFSSPNDLILDPFNGSGNTLIACHIEKRKAIGIELDKKYVEITKSRLSEYEK